MQRCVHYSVFYCQTLSSTQHNQGYAGMEEGKSVGQVVPGGGDGDTWKVEDYSNTTAGGFYLKRTTRNSTPDLER